MKKNVTKNLLAACLVAIPLVMNAQDRIFTYTYQSGVLNQGQREIEVWNTLRTGKTEYFSRLDHRTELEVGLGKNLQTAFYLNLTSKTKGVGSNGSYSLANENKISFSNEWKYKLMDPVANPFGLALYGEYGIGTNEYELEGKVIVDKKIGAVTLAANIIYEMELEPGYNGSEFELEAEEHKADFNFSTAYSLNRRFNLTMESAFRNVFTENGLEHSALYAGLGLSYVQDNFFINFSILPQLKSFRGNDANITLNLNEFEKIQCRLLLSYAL
ncbi:MAG TPA: hypothetical protein VK152_02725 [Paludibacter sp.]|nr:hypothetical protein [Paludibacter sp.]